MPPFYLLTYSLTRVQASIIFIHFGIEGVMDLLALDCAKVRPPSPPPPPLPLAPTLSLVRHSRPPLSCPPASTEH